MSDVAIRVENLSKQYRIGGPQARYRTIRESLVEAVQTPFRRLSSVVRGQSSVLSAETIWALKDVSFEVHRGEVVGIIGRNGAGKTTLLKILSRITEPTEGYAEIDGRVGSLLEVGTGFHPELTGRENIYLNGAVLGMKKAEVERKFDEIVDFSGVEKFIDTPMKHYSSGMYVRLAFAVAAHLEPEILLVDEVLAVGDAAFQKKCLGKMENVAKGGRTVLFVSHNMSAVTRLCPRAILLDDGRLVQDGRAAEVTSAYLRHAVEAGGSRDWPRDTAPGTDELRLTSVSLLDGNGTATSLIGVNEPLTLRIGYHVGRPNLGFRCVAVFFTQGVCVFTSIEPTAEKRESVGNYYSILHIPPNLLAEGEYTVGLALRTATRHYAEIREAISFQIFDPMTGSSARGDYTRHLGGVVRPLLQWELSYEGYDGKDCHVETTR